MGQVTLASLPGIKLDTARNIGAADVYFEMNGKSPEGNLLALQKSHPIGFDVVIEATGVTSVLESSINLVCRGGTLGIFGVYPSAKQLMWDPNVLLVRHINIVGSISEVNRFPTAVAYLESSKVCVKGVVNKVFRIEEWEACLESLRSPGTVKAAIVFD